MHIFPLRGCFICVVTLLLFGLFFEFTSSWTVDCSSLQIGQYLCIDLIIDPQTQQPKDCNRSTLLAPINCTAAEEIICSETNSKNFIGYIPCLYTNGYSFETAVLLSVFLGMFGIDRIYLGYYAIGLAKFCTLGFLFLGHLVDIILIATQTVGPADGSSYVINYYGPVLNVLYMNNNTYRMPQDDWVVT